MIPFPRAFRPLPGEPGAFALTVEAEHPAFEGHFEGRPVLAGVIQLDWALRAGEAAFGPLGVFTGVEHLKFQALIGPGEPLELRLAWDAAQRSLDFVYSGPEGRKSSGLTRFAAP